MNLLKTFVPEFAAFDFTAPVYASTYDVIEIHLDPCKIVSIQRISPTLAKNMIRTSAQNNITRKMNYLQELLNSMTTKSSPNNAIELQSKKIETFVENNYESLVDKSLLLFDSGYEIISLINYDKMIELCKATTTLNG